MASEESVYGHLAPLLLQPWQGRNFWKEGHSEGKCLTPQHPGSRREKAGVGVTILPQKQMSSNPLPPMRSCFSITNFYSNFESIIGLNLWLGQSHQDVMFLKMCLETSPEVYFANLLGDSQFNQAEHQH